MQTLSFTPTLETQTARMMGVEGVVNQAAQAHQMMGASATIQAARLGNPTYAAQGGSAAGFLCSQFPNLPRCQEIAAPCAAGSEPCGTTISGKQRCCPSGAPAPGPSRKFSLPSGKVSRVRSHRSFRTPRGGLTFNPQVASVTTRYVKRWAPAYQGTTPAIGSRGAWISLPRDEYSQVGVLHSPGLKARSVRVLAVEGDHALVRYRADAAPNPAYGRSVVSTRSRRTRRALVKAPGGGTVAKKFDWCGFFPNSNKCQQTLAAACPPGHEWVLGRCIPGSLPGNPGRGVRRARVKVNPTVSAAEHRRQATGGGGMGSLGQTLRDLGSGRARLVVDRTGISVRNKNQAA